MRIQWDFHAYIKKIILTNTIKLSIIYNHIFGSLNHFMLENGSKEGTVARRNTEEPSSVLDDKYKQ